MSNIEQIAQSLNSESLSERNLATQQLLRIRNIDEIESFIANHGEVFQLQLINLFNNILNELEPSRCVWALKKLISYIGDYPTVAGKVAGVAVEDFFSNTDVQFNFKSFLVAKAFVTTIVPQRLFLTRLIRKNKLIGLSKELASNFKIKNNTLLVETVGTFVDLGDRRGLRLIRALSKSRDVDISCVAIHALGHLGDVTDLLSLTQLSSHQNHRIRLASFEALENSLGSFSFYILKRLYYKEKLPILKVSLLRIMLRDNIHKSLPLVLHEYSSTTDTEYELELIKLVRNVTHANKSKILWPFLIKMSQSKFLGIIDCLTHIDANLIREIDHFINSKHDLLCRLCLIDQLGNIPDILVINTLKKLYQFENNKLIKLQVYNSLCSASLIYSPKSIQLEPPVDESIESDLHIIYCKYLFKVTRNVLNIDKKYSTYLMGLLDSLNFDVVCSALNSLRYYYSSDNYIDLINFYATSERIELKSIMLITLRSMLYRAKDIDLATIDILPNELFTSLDVTRVNNRLIRLLIESMKMERASYSLIEFFKVNHIALRDRVEEYLMNVDDEKFLELTLPFLNLDYVFDKRIHKRLKALSNKNSAVIAPILQYFLKLGRKDDLSFILSNMDGIRRQELQAHLKTYLGVII